MMKFSFFILLECLFLLSVIIKTVESQRRTPPPRGRNAGGRSTRVRVKPKFTVKKKQTSEPNLQQIQCLVCNGEFLLNTFDAAHLCYNPGLNATAARRSLVSSCPLDARYCVTEVTRVHGVFISIQRRCGGTFCVEACFHKGFGTERESCTYCCEPVKSIHFAISEDAVMPPVMINEISSMTNPMERTNTESESMNTGLDVSIGAMNLTARQQKELLYRQQANQMLSAYNCPPSYRNEF